MESSDVRVVIRPLKVIASICVLISAILILISLVTGFWLEAEEFSQGLWYCSGDKCKLATDKDWVVACGVASSVALVVALVAFVLILLCLLLKNQSLKSAFHFASIAVTFFAIICLLVSLILFPIMFIKNIEFYQKEFRKTDWSFSWSYGISWGAWLFLVGAAVLLLIDKTRNNFIRKEKGFYDTNL